MAAAGVIYLDIDDELTSAASRIRSAEARRVAIVLPNGSRVATSRINFRLLARDALTHEKALSIIAGDAATRALAASAGLAVFSTVAEYEASPEGAARGSATSPAGSPTVLPLDLGATERVTTPMAEPPSPRGGRRAARATKPASSEVHQATLDEMEAAELAAASAALALEAARPPTSPAAAPSVRRPEAARPRDQARPLDDLRGERPSRIGASGSSRGGGRTRTSLLVALGVLALVVLVGGVGAYLFLPAATVVVRPRIEAVTPVVMTIVADPTATEPDPQRGVVPAVSVDVNVAVTDTFPATGKRVEETKAKAVVRFRNKDFTSSNTIPAGSVVSTANGIRFKTDKTVTVARANIVGLQVFPKTASVGVTAVKAGPEGNVEPNTIVVIPRGEDPISLDVNNLDAASGGERTEFTRIKQEDIDAAMATLQAALEASFEDRLSHDPSIAPPGATVFPATGRLGIATPTVADLSTLVDLEVETFDLGLTASGTAIAVDEAPVSSVAQRRLEASIDAGHRLVDGSIKVVVEPAVVSGATVTFPASAAASQVALLDADALKALILGRSLAEARTILSSYGSIDVSTWPDWVSTIPTIEGRVDLTIDAAVPIDAITPTASP